MVNAQLHTPVEGLVYVVGPRKGNDPGFVLGETGESFALMTPKHPPTPPPGWSAFFVGWWRPFGRVAWSDYAAGDHYGRSGTTCFLTCLRLLAAPANALYCRPA